MDTLERKGFNELLQAKAQPFSVDDLIARGILTRAGNGWYVVRKWDELPKNAEARIVEIARGWRVKFSR